jgi:hypothetical protein
MVSWCHGVKVSFSVLISHFTTFQMFSLTVLGSEGAVAQTKMALLSQA